MHDDDDDDDNDDDDDATMTGSSERVAYIYENTYTKS
jgi:hypothetical protein